MSQQKKTAKAVFTVLLTSGHEVSHEYDAPVESYLTDHILDAVRRKVSFLFLENPLAVYNSDAVAGIQFSFVTAEQIEEFTKQLNKKTGFVK